MTQTQHQHKKMTTALSRVRGLGAAGGGTQHFWHQRITALFNIPLTLFFVCFVAHYIAAPHTQIVSALRAPYVAAPLLLLIISMTWHMRLGLQVVIEDYITTPALKWAAFIFNLAFCASIALFSALSLLKIMGLS